MLVIYSSCIMKERGLVPFFTYTMGVFTGFRTFQTYIYMPPLSC